jgi:hypothetical protein
MKKALALILICIACDSKKARDPIGYNIEGKWVYFENNVMRYKDRLVDHYSGIEFDDNEFYYVGDDGRTLVGDYQLRNDTLIVEDGNKRLVYKVLALTNDSLSYLDEDVTRYYYNQKLDFNPELQLDSIYIKAGQCFDNCQEFEFTIEKGERRGKFVGGKNSKYQGERYIQFSDKEWDKMDSLFKWSRIELYDSSLFYGAIDDRVIDLEIRYNRDKVKKIRGTQGGLLRRLQPIVESVFKKLNEEGVFNFRK